jgi:hypothetical protein
VLFDGEVLRRENQHRELGGRAPHLGDRLGRQRAGEVDVADRAGEARGHRGQGDRHGVFSS